MVAMVKVAHSDNIEADWFDNVDLDWLDEDDKGKKINKEITECMIKIFDETPPDLWMPIYFGKSDGINGPPVEDPGTIYISLPLAGRDDQVCWSTTLNALIDDVISGHVLNDGKIHDEEGKEICRRLMRHLRENAIKLELAMAKEDQLSVSGS